MKKLNENKVIETKITERWQGRGTCMAQSVGLLPSVQVMISGS